MKRLDNFDGQWWKLYAPIRRSRTIGTAKNSCSPATTPVLLPANPKCISPHAQCITTNPPSAKSVLYWNCGSGPENEKASCGAAGSSLTQASLTLLHCLRPAPAPCPSTQTSPLWPVKVAQPSYMSAVCPGPSVPSVNLRFLSSGLLPPSLKRPKSRRSKQTAAPCCKSRSTRS